MVTSLGVPEILWYIDVVHDCDDREQLSVMKILSTKTGR